MAVRRYLAKAYARVPARLEEQFCPPPDVDLVAWLLRDDIERQPDTQDIEQVKAVGRAHG